MTLHCILTFEASQASACLQHSKIEAGDLQKRSGWRPSGAELRPGRIDHDDRPFDGVFGHRDKRLMKAAGA